MGVARQGDWLDYIAGCVWALHQQGYPVPGLRAYVHSEVPMGGGLSSSAALEVAALRALRALYRLPLDDMQIALLAQQAEAAYVGVRCGIMDQMAASLGRLGYGLFLDTQNLQTRLAPLPQGYRVAVVDSAVPRRLAESGYNTRRSECERACELLGVKSLRELSPADLPRLEALPEPLNRRARHVVTENQRVLDGVQALEQGNIKRFGELMVASHISLRDDYEVSIPELDQLVEAELRHGTERWARVSLGPVLVAPRWPWSRNPGTKSLCRGFCRITPRRGSFNPLTTREECHERAPLNQRSGSGFGDLR